MPNTYSVYQRSRGEWIVEFEGQIIYYAESRKDAMTFVRRHRNAY